jgi:hypothetical protein
MRPMSFACKHCSGTGRIWPPLHPIPSSPDGIPCPDCAGTGDAEMDPFSGTKEKNTSE